ARRACAPSEPLAFSGKPTTMRTTGSRRTMSRSVSSTGARPFPRSSTASGDASKCSGSLMATPTRRSPASMPRTLLGAADDNVNTEGARRPRGCHLHCWRLSQSTQPSEIRARILRGTATERVGDALGIDRTFQHARGLAAQDHLVAIDLQHAGHLELRGGSELRI